MVLIKLVIVYKYSESAISNIVIDLIVWYIYYCICVGRVYMYIYICSIII